MALCRLLLRPFHSFALFCLFIGLTASLSADEPVKALPPALEKPAPEGLDDLRAIQKQTRGVLAKVIPATVGVRIGQAQGSGVIVSKDGLVLTAGHVSGQPGRDAILIFPDGKTVKGKTLGANAGVDSGLIQITDKGEWPFVEMGKSSGLKRGQWCLAIGQPGGYHKGRTPPVRLGRILEQDRSIIRTDCALVGGDSGGPLFDMQGRVIGIHSRIGGQLTANIHVPVDAYRDDWDRLVNSEIFGGPTPNGPFVGVRGDLEGDDCRILRVVPDSPADKAGLKVDDIIQKFNGRKIASFEEFIAAVQKKKVGDEVSLEVLRGKETLTVKLKLGKRPE